MIWVIRDKSKKRGSPMQSAHDKGKWIEMREDKTERNDVGPKSDENITLM